MTDRPIIFSEPMVRALLDGRKTQTRRLARSPLRHVQIGDRLYVREAFGICRECLYANPRAGINKPSNCAACDTVVARFTPSIHMPRSASRLTLMVEDVRFQRLHSITPGDAVAEGVEQIGGGWRDYRGGDAVIPFPDTAFKFLWDRLHHREGERWQDNPAIVALTFRVVRANIDGLTADGM